jgi:hypothetical protein
MTVPPVTHPSPRFRAASEITARPVDWLWPGRLALGELAILEGDPGLGKSFLALDLCARLSTGRPWPDESPAPAAASVYLSGEDSDEATVGPRLRALGADLTRVFLHERDGGELAATLSLPADVAAVEDVVARTQARLLVLDPVTHFLGDGANLHTRAGLRRALGPLAALARRCGCVVLLVRHLNKGEGQRALYRGLGGMGLVGTCRSAWLVARDADEPGRCVLAQVKNNLAVPQPSLAFTMTTAEDGSPALNWLGPVEAGADDLMGTPNRGRRPVKRREATAFLQEALADGPLKVSDLWERAGREGLGEKTVRDAKDQLDIRSVMVVEDGRRVNYWLLPGQTAPGGEKPEEEMSLYERDQKVLDELYERDMQTLFGKSPPPRPPADDEEE